MDLFKLRLIRSQSAIRQNKQLNSTLPSTTRSASSLNNVTSHHIPNQGCFVLNGMAIESSGKSLTVRPKTTRSPRRDLSRSMGDSGSKCSSARQSSNTSDTTAETDQPTYCDYPEIDDLCKLVVRLSVNKLILVPPAPRDQTLSPAYKRKFLHLYIALIRDQDIILEQLKEMFDIIQLDISDITSGYLRLCLEFKNLQVFNQFIELNTSSKMVEKLKHIIFSDELLKEVGIGDLELGIHIKDDELVKCHRKLLAKEKTSEKLVRREKKFPTKQRTASKDLAQVVRVPPTPKPNHSSISHQINKNILNALAIIQQRYQTFEQNLEEFLMILKLVKPVEIEQFHSISDVMRCHKFLIMSPVVGANLRTELVKEFLLIINIFRVTIEDIKSEAKTINTNPKTATIKDKITDWCLHLQEKCDPSFDFSNISEESTSDISLNALDRQMFKDLVCFIPWLIKQATTFKVLLEDLQ